MPTNIPDVTQKLKRNFWPTEYFSMDTKHFTAKNDPRRKQSTISRIVKNIFKKIIISKPETQSMDIDVQSHIRVAY